MNKVVFVITMLFVAVSLCAQITIQRGVAYRYNGKKPRTPLGGVYLKPANSDNGVVSDEKTGSFNLALKNCRMGERIGSVRVTKQGMMVFNQDAVDEWSVRKAPLRLILCDVHEFEKQKENLIAIGKREAQKKYDKSLAELKKQNETRQLELDDYYNKLDSLEKELQNAMKHMDEYADVFARIDESEIDSLAQRAVELFNKGEIEESIRLLEEGNYEKRLDDALRTKSQAQELRHLADSAEALADNDIDRCMNAIKTQVSAYKLNNEFQKAGALLKSMADKLQSLEATWDYAMFCYDQNQFVEAETYFLKFEDMLKRSPDGNKDAQYVRLYNRLGALYERECSFQKSEEMLLQGLRILEQTKSEDYESYVRIYINLSLTYIALHRTIESESVLKKCFEYFENLSKDNDEIESLMAGAENNLGLLYYNMKRYDESERAYMKAFVVFECLSKDNTTEHMSYLALIYYNIARLYADTKRIGESEDMYKKSLDIYELLSKDNPNAFGSKYASALVGLGSICSDTRRLGESEEMYKKALAIYERLSKNNPKPYEERFGWLYTSLGNLYVDAKRFGESEEMYKKAFAIYEQLSKKDPKVYEIYLANMYHNYGRLYRETKRYDKCEKMFERELVIIKSLYDKYSDDYEERLEMCYSILGWACLENGEYSSAYNYNKILLSMVKNKYLQETKCNKYNYTHQLIIQSLCANLLGKFSEGEAYSLEVLQADSTNHMAYSNLAAALLFQGRVAEAEKLYRQYKQELKDTFLEDFVEYERLKVVPKERIADVERIKKMLKAD